MHEILSEVLEALLIYSLLTYIARVQSQIEARIRRPRACVVKRAVPWSLSVFKLGRTALFALSGLECAMTSGPAPHVRTLGLVGFILGAALRLAAIRRLGSCWSNHADLVEGQCQVIRGPYRYLHHPAYVGNIHIPALLLFVGATVSAVGGLALISWFFAVRVPHENKFVEALPRD